MTSSYFREIKPGYLEIKREEIPLNCPELKTQLLDYLSRIIGSVKNLTLNFSDVREACTSCPAILVQVLARARKQGIELTLEGLTERVATQIDIAKLSPIFRITYS
ncbi:MAG: STAS domain-containing protein [Nanoarchaeota archaeon]|nr:STAS domain-containing protein [Nanoarchaeota archaeon]MBU4085969.1 STAS domain-containing protein [Nanoarchaeota archaeon]